MLMHHPGSILPDSFKNLPPSNIERSAMSALLAGMAASLLLVAPMDVARA